VLESNGKQYQTSQEPQQISNAKAPFHPTLVFASPEQKSEIMVCYLFFKIFFIHALREHTIRSSGSHVLKHFTFYELLWNLLNDEKALFISFNVAGAGSDNSLCYQRIT